MEQTQATEYKQFVARWDYQMTELEHKTKTQESQMNIRHQEEQLAFQKDWQAAQMKVKWTSDLLNMRRQEEHLIRQREFMKAAKVRNIVILHDNVHHCNHHAS